MNAPWLFAEAYKYRRLRECFSLSKYWVDYGEPRQSPGLAPWPTFPDVFFRQKCDTFSRSNTAVFELSTRFSHPTPQDEHLSEEAKRQKDKLIFLELTQGWSKTSLGFFS